MAGYSAADIIILGSWVFRTQHSFKNWHK